MSYYTQRYSESLRHHSSKIVVNCDKHDLAKYYIDLFQIFHNHPRFVNKTFVKVPLDLFIHMNFNTTYHIIRKILPKGLCINLNGDIYNTSEFNPLGSLKVPLNIETGFQGEEHPLSGLGRYGSVTTDLPAGYQPVTTEFPVENVPATRGSNANSRFPSEANSNIIEKAPQSVVPELSTNSSYRYIPVNTRVGDLSSHRDYTNVNVGENRSISVDNHDESTEDYDAEESMDPSSDESSSPANRSTCVNRTDLSSVQPQYPTSQTGADSGLTDIGINGEQSSSDNHNSGELEYSSNPE